MIKENLHAWKLRESENIKQKKNKKKQIITRNDGFISVFVYLSSLNKNGYKNGLSVDFSMKETGKKSRSSEEILKQVIKKLETINLMMPSTKNEQFISIKRSLVRKFIFSITLRFFGY